MRVIIINDMERDYQAHAQFCPDVRRREAAGYLNSSWVIDVDPDADIQAAVEADVNEDFTDPADHWPVRVLPCVHK